jgi:hypothetical protein
MWATVPHVAPPRFYLEDLMETTNNDSRRPGRLESNSSKLEVVLPCALCRMQTAHATVNNRQKEMQFAVGPENSADPALLPAALQICATYRHLDWVLCLISLPTSTSGRSLGLHRMPTSQWPTDRWQWRTRSSAKLFVQAAVTSLPVIHYTLALCLRLT